MGRSIYLTLMGFAALRWSWWHPAFVSEVRCQSWEWRDSLVECVPDEKCLVFAFVFLCSMFMDDLLTQLFSRYLGLLSQSWLGSSNFPSWKSDFQLGNRSNRWKFQLPILPSDSEAPWESLTHLIVMVHMRCESGCGWLWSQQPRCEFFVRHYLTLSSCERLRLRCLLRSHGSRCEWGFKHLESGSQDWVIGGS